MSTPRLTTQSHRDRAHHVHSHRQKTWRETRSSVADDLVKYPDTDAVRHGRAQGLKYPERRRSEAGSRVALDLSRRTHSDSHAYARRDIEVATPEKRRRNASLGQHPSNNAEKEKHHDKAHTHRNAKSNVEYFDSQRPQNVRRSRTADDRSSAIYERSYEQERRIRPEMRYPERRRPRPEEESSRATLRREKRSITENVPRRHREAPLIRCQRGQILMHVLSRSASVHEDKTPSIFRPFLRRSQTSAHNTPQVRPRPETKPPPIARLSPTAGCGSRGTMEQGTPIARGRKGGERPVSVFSFMGPPKASHRPEPEKT